MASGMTFPLMSSLRASVSKPATFASLPSGPIPPSTQILESVPPPNPKEAPHNTQWTPPQWATTALTIIKVTYPPYTVDPVNQAEPVTFDYVFDAVFKLTHRRTMRKTSHPVLTGPNISDHAYIEPTRVSLEIGMSDAMAAYGPDMWTSGYTKSVSAWLKIKEFQEKKLVVSLLTRIDTYNNMMVIEAEALDDYTSTHGLRARILLEELISATVYALPPISARSNASDSTSVGVVQGVEPNPDQVDQHLIPDLVPDPNAPPFKGWNDWLKPVPPFQGWNPDLPYGDKWGALPDGTAVPTHLYDGEHMTGNNIWKVGDVIPTGSPF